MPCHNARPLQVNVRLVVTTDHKLTFDLQLTSYHTRVPRRDQNVQRDSVVVRGNHRDVMHCHGSTDSNREATA